MALFLELEEQRKRGLEIMFLASLDPADRDALATKEERAAAIAMRKLCVMSGHVRQALQCSVTELDRWDADGRLRHLYPEASITAGERIRSAGSGMFTMSSVRCLWWKYGVQPIKRKHASGGREQSRRITQLSLGSSNIRPSNDQ